ncbi:hypothetical protein bcgnr5390_00640 [Bacillus luti]
MNHQRVKGAIQELQKFSSIHVPLDYLKVIQHCTHTEINVKNELFYALPPNVICVVPLLGTNIYTVSRYITNILLF